METTSATNVQQKRGAEDSGAYFRYMSEFVGLTAKDAEMIRQTKPVIEKHLPEIVGKFYTHLLRYPPTRQWFLREDGTVDQDYLELRMRHLTNFWLRTADAMSRWAPARVPASVLSRPLVRVMTLPPSSN